MPASSHYPLRSRAICYNGLMNEKIERRLKQAIAEEVTPNAVVGYVEGDGQPHFVAAGSFAYEDSSPEVTADSLYDVASITKSIPTSTIILWLIDQGRLRLDDLVQTYLPELDGRYWERATIKHLLTYTAILDLKGIGLSKFAEQGVEELRRILLHSDLKSPPGKEYWYTNAPSILLGMVAEKVFQKKLNLIADELFFHPLGMSRSTFTPTQFSMDEIVPSEIVQGRVVQGVPCDETARVFAEAGEPVGVAGLFSTAKDLLTFAQMMANHGTHEGKTYLHREIVEQLRTNQIASLGDTTGLGWEVGRPYMGRRSAELFGKGGFTGCAVVIDPGTRKAVVIMASYLYPERRALTNRDAINRLRADVADLVLGP